MQLHNLKRNKNNKKSKRVGRGGRRGKTSGRGTKGQNARSGRKKRPEMRDIIKKFPKLRGRGKNFLKSIKEKNAIITVSDLGDNFSSGDSVNISTLIKKNIINVASGNTPNVKILSDGNLDKKLFISGIKASLKARAKIEKAGGSLS